jgi:rfaE bifunctional protein kinase chain/domain
MAVTVASRSNANTPSDDRDAIISDIRKICPTGRIVFVSGNFNIIHPGHLRLLNFAAECGDCLILGIIDDRSRETLLPATLRLEGAASIGVVDYAFILREPVVDFISRLKPEVVVKGKEYEDQYNPELAAITAYGGKLLFSSGEVRFSSLDLLRKEIHDADFPKVQRSLDYLDRHGISLNELRSIIANFSKLRVVVIGDLIVDEYITCEPLGMSQEDPTIVVSPIERDRFVGGAGCVASHIAGLGAYVRYFCVTGDDETSQYAQQCLSQRNVRFDFLADGSRPTTLKQRFRAGNKTLLRVSHLRQHDIDANLIETMYDKVIEGLEGANVLIFSDFNYGCLPQTLVDRIREFCIKRGIMMAADSQASSQMSDVSRFHSVAILTPTEHEARIAMRDSRSGLVVLADALCRKANAENVLITLASEGALIHSPRSGGGSITTDRLPAFNTAPKDVTGAGDSLLTCATLVLAAGADIWRAAYLGSLAAAFQVGRIGNHAITAADLLSELHE